MRDLFISEISATAGRAGDGVIRGSLLRSLLEVGWVRSSFIGGLVALRKDAGAGSTYESITLSSDIGSTAQPFGTTMVAGDQLFIDADDDICELFFTISTSGAYVGDGIEVMESLDGKTLVPVLNLQDTSNGFRAASGAALVYRLKWDDRTRRAFSPEFGGTERRYIVIRPKNLGTVTTTPILGRVWASCPEEVFSLTDRTSPYNGDINSGTFTTTVDTLMTLTSESVFGFKGLSAGYDIFMYQSHEVVAARTHEYLASNNTWKPFTSINDPSNVGMNGPTALGQPMQEFRVRWDIPADWAKMPLTLNGTVYNAYFMRRRPTSILEYRPSRPAYFRVRSRSFGDGLSTGIRSAVGQTISAVHVTIDVPPTVDTTITFSNYLTGASRSVIIPANSRSSYLPFSSPLVIPAVGGFLLYYVSGGSMRDVAIHFS